MAAKIRSAYIQDQKTVSDSDTTIADIKVQKPITAIDVKFQATNGATRNELEGLHLDVDVIEVVDGATVITSLNAGQILGANFYQQGRIPPYQFLEAGSGVQHLTARLLFGRYYGDLEYYLDPTKLTNPQVKVVNSLTISATAGYTSGSGKLSLIFHILEEGAKAQRGVIRMVEHKEFTSADSGEADIPLPIDEVIRRLYVRSREAAVNWETDITKMRIVQNKTIRITDDIRTTDWFDILTQKYGLAQVEKELLASNDDTRQLSLGTIKELSISSAFSARNALIDAISGNQVTVDLYDLATPTADATDRPLRVIAKGYAPWHVLAWDFGDPLDPDSWLDPTGYESLEAILTQGGAGATVEVYSERVMVQA